MFDIASSIFSVSTVYVIKIMAYHFFILHSIYNKF